MLKRLITFTIMVAVSQAFFAGSALAATRFRAQDATASKVKTDVAQYSRRERKVTVKLKDGSKLTGYITQAGDDSFTLTDSKTHNSRTLTYAEVAQVKKAGGLSWLAKVGIGLGVGVGALALLYVIGKGRCNGFGCP